MLDIAHAKTPAHWFKAERFIETEGMRLRIERHHSHTLFPTDFKETLHDRPADTSATVLPPDRYPGDLCLVTDEEGPSGSNDRIADSSQDVNAVPIVRVVPDIAGKTLLADEYLVPNSVDIAHLI